MYKLKKSIALLLMFAMLTLTSITPVFAQTQLEYLPTVQITSKQSKIPNIVEVDAIGKKDGTGVNVIVSNLGVDGLDNVKIDVSATGYSTPKTKKGYIPALVGKTFEFNIPMIKCNTKYNVLATVTDGGDVETIPASAEVYFSESNLANAHWNKGTKSSRAASLEYHFDKHGSEVGAKNIVYYLNYANYYRDEVLEDIKSFTMNKYTISPGTGSIPSKKYTSRYTGEFIILANSDNSILSYGGN